MVSTAASTPSFLRDALMSYASFSSSQKQDVQKHALKWLQSRIEAEIADKTIIDQFTQKWRVGTKEPLNANEPPLHLESLPGSYKGNNSINAHQEDALLFIHEKVSPQLQEEFGKHWNAKTKLEVSNSSGTPFKIDEREKNVLQQQDPDGNGTAWYQVEKRQIYYLISSELKDDHYLVVLSEGISPQNRTTWFVAQADINISNI